MPDSRISYHAMWRACNPELKKAIDKKYITNNPEKRRATVAKYTAANREKKRAWDKKNYLLKKQRLIEETFVNLRDKVSGLFIEKPVVKKQKKAIIKKRSRKKRLVEEIFINLQDKTKKIGLFKFSGEEHTLKDWCNILGLNIVVVKGRLYHQGLSIEQAFTKPHRYNKDRERNPGKTYGHKKGTST